MQIIKLKTNENIPVNYTGIIERDDGAKFWYLNGAPHRVDGPAVEYPDGEKHWYLYGKLHRVDGLALEYADGTKFWFLNNEFIFKLEPEDQPFLILEATKNRVKILTTTKTKWIKNVPGLKDLENKPCKQ